MSASAFLFRIRLYCNKKRNVNLFFKTERRMYIFHNIKMKIKTSCNTLKKCLFARKLRGKSVDFFLAHFSQIKGKEGNLSQTAISNAMTNAKID